MKNHDDIAEKDPTDQLLDCSFIFYHNGDAVNTFQLCIPLVFKLNKAKLASATGLTETMAKIDWFRLKETPSMVSLETNTMIESKFHGGFCLIHSSALYAWGSNGTCHAKCFACK